MQYIEIITIIISFFVIFQWLSNSLNRRIDDLRESSRKGMDDLKELFKAELDFKIRPIEIALNNHITDTNKDIKALTYRVDNIEKDLKTLTFEMKDVNTKMDEILKELRKS